MYIKVQLVKGQSRNKVGVGNLLPLTAPTCEQWIKIKHGYMYNVSISEYSHSLCDNGWPEGHEVCGGEFEQKSPETEEHFRRHSWVTL